MQNEVDSYKSQPMPMVTMLGCVPSRKVQAHMQSDLPQQSTNNIGPEANSMQQSYPRQDQCVFHKLAVAKGKILAPKDCLVRDACWLKLIFGWYNVTLSFAEAQQKVRKILISHALKCTIW